MLFSEPQPRGWNSWGEQSVHTFRKKSTLARRELRVLEDPLEWKTSSNLINQHAEEITNQTKYN